MSQYTMRFLHVVGRRNHGKTTLIQELVKLLSSRGIVVGTIKHCAHRHELEAPTKDSRKHREAGADPAGIITKDTCAIHLPRGEGEDPYLRLQPFFQACRLVLVEGHIEGPGPKVEVFRESVDPTPLVVENGQINAIISDDKLEAGVPVWSRSDLDGLADRLLADDGPLWS